MEPEQKEEKVPTRDTYWGRWEMIRECQIPAEFVASGKKRKQGDKTQDLPGAHVVKAVLLDLAEHDKPGNSIFKGLDSVQHATGLSMRSINKGIKALEDAGIIKRKHRGMGKSKYSVLDWDRVESLRKPFFAVNRDGDGASPRADSEDQRFGDELPPEPSSSVSAAILSLEFVGSKLTRKEADTLAASLGKRYREDQVLTAITTLTPKQLERTAQADDVAAYLRISIGNALKSSMKAVAPKPEQTSTDAATSRAALEPATPSSDIHRWPLTASVPDTYFFDLCAQVERRKDRGYYGFEKGETDQYVREWSKRLMLLGAGRVLVEPLKEYEDGSRCVILGPAVAELVHG